MDRQQKLGSALNQGCPIEEAAPVLLPALARRRDFPEGTEIVPLAFGIIHLLFRCLVRLG
jgi:hypothetical protein